MATPDFPPTRPLAGAPRYYSEREIDPIERHERLTEVHATANDYDAGLVTVSVSTGDTNESYGFEFDLSPDEAVALAADLVAKAKEARQ